LNSWIQAYIRTRILGIKYQHKLPGRWKGKIRLPTKEKKTSDTTTLTQYYLLLQFSFSNYLANNIQRLIHEVKLGRLFFRPSQGIILKNILEDLGKNASNTWQCTFSLFSIQPKNINFLWKILIFHNSAIRKDLMHSTH